MKQLSDLSRRQFIRITASAGLLLAGSIGLGIANISGANVRVEEAQLLLGSIAHLTIISKEPERARQAIRAAFSRMSELEDVFSRFRPYSQLSKLNTDGHINDVHPALHEVLTRAVAYGRLTDGAFDVTIEPVLRLYHEASKIAQLPDEAALIDVQQLVDYRQIAITQNGIQLNKVGMAVTLDGIAKGYIIDEGTAVLSEYGFEHIMVELGGDLQTRGNAGSRPWQIGIQSPRQNVTNTASFAAQLEGSAMATSGDYLYTFTPDRRLHHIIDPRSGISPDELASASVIAGTACDADALATAVMIMGVREGLALIERLPSTETFIITKQGNIHHSSHFPLL
jgi:thiamine biosynthesis lipoprotein